MKQQPAEEWGRECLVGSPNDRRYLVGVSGGRDSVALLHWLLSLGYDRLVVCHFEHGLRGRAGESDARFVARLARARGLRFEFGSADVAALAVQRKQSIETAARQERLAFFEKVGRGQRCQRIFLAHQADDQVETFLLNLFRGAGRRGLGAMRPRSNYGSLEIVRPLLGVWRTEIDHYLAEHRVKFRDDATNEQLNARRNRLRRQIIPWLEKRFGRNIRVTIWRAATVLAEEEEFLESQTPVRLTKSEELSVAELGQLPRTLQRRAIKNWLGHQGIADIGFDDVEAVIGLLAGGVPAKINLARDRHARRRAGKIFLE
ncbi:MAG: tRNA lysidine(34) synthetase TilS [Chthoniobacterales bacterium]